MTEQLPFIPYPPIEKHGTIGDRRTAALVAADGTLDWLCLPDYDGESLFAALLDAKEGRFWRFGPRIASLGQQRYLGERAALVTTWTTPSSRLELTDIMAWPQDKRPDALQESRVVLRRLRCVRGECECRLSLYPRANFRRAASVMQVSGGLELRNLTYAGPRRKQARRSAMVLHLLNDAPDGSLVAAPTTSLPERLEAFRQHYAGEGLDASVLLIPVMGFLPSTHPRVLSTVRRIEEALMIDGFVYRFQPGKTPGYEDIPVGEFEGAFLPCTFWLATTYALQGRIQDADDLLTNAERLAGSLGIFAEEVDARSGHFLGNMPLLFSHMEYVRAIEALAQAQHEKT